MNDGRVVSNFIIQALQGKPITIYGAGNQTRSFQYVSDLVDGLVSLMNSNTSVISRFFIISGAFLVNILDLTVSTI
jgi:nucleoside-diphosphate-sugar epimerase